MKHSPLIRALTLWRPWAAAIAHGSKRVENRSWYPPSPMIGAWLAIHAGKRWDDDAEEFALLRMMGDPRQAAFIKHARDEGIVGVARLVGATDMWGVQEPDKPWAFGPVCWHLDDVVALPRPIPCRGAQGLWVLPDGVEAEVLATAEARR